MSIQQIYALILKHFDININLALNSWTQKAAIQLPFDQIHISSL